MRLEKRIRLFVSVVVLIVLVSFAFAGDFFALQGNVKQNGVGLDSGNLTVYIYDDYSAGNLVYNSSSDFNNAILNGKYDVLLGNGSQVLNLDYGRKYYFEIYINNERLNFTGGITRQVFQSSIGNISSMYINFTTGITLPAGQNVSLGLGGWFKGLFNWIISSESQNYVTFNGTSLNLTENVTKWLYNQTSGISGINFINGTILDITNITNFNYNYNQTYSGSTFNATYALWAYNQTYSGSTYNETYALWAYNQTGSVYNASYVPYTGATSNVNLGNYNLTTTGVVNTGFDSRFGNVNRYIEIKEFNATGSAIGDLGYIPYFKATTDGPLKGVVFQDGLVLTRDDNLPQITFTNSSLSEFGIIKYNVASNLFTITSDTLIDAGLNVSAGNDICIAGGNCLSTVTGSVTNGTILDISNITNFFYNYNQTQASSWNLSGSNLFMVSNDYSLGIGTSTPTQKFDVVGSVNISGNIYTNGSAEFGGGWQNNGVTISDGKIYAQTGYFYNITSLAVTNLNVNASIYPGIDFDNQFDLGSATSQWRNGYFGTDVLIAGVSVKNWTYNQTTAAMVYGNTTWIPYTGATTDVDLGNHSLETSGILTVGMDYAAQFIPVKLLVNGTSFFNKDLHSSDYVEIIGSVLSIGYGNYFRTNVYEISSNPNTFVSGLAVTASTPASLGNLSGLQLYGINGDVSIGSDTSVDYVRSISSDLSIEGNVTSQASSIYVGASGLTGNINQVRGISIEDFSRESLFSGGIQQLGDSYAIYSAGGDVYFEDVNNYTIKNASNTASLCLNGVCYTSLASSTYNATYALYAYNMSDGSYNASYVPYSGATTNVDLGNNNLTVGSNTLFVNPLSGQVGIGTDYINDTYMLRVAGSVLIDGNLTFLGNSSQLSIQGLSSNGSIIPEYDDTYYIGNLTAQWKYGYFSQDVYIGGNSVSDWMYNQSDYSINSLNSTYGKFWYNQTYSGSTFNTTYALYAYNHTQVANTSIVNTYGKWWYNQSIGINISMVNAYGKWWYNMTYSGSTYNATYALWIYNQTQASGWNISTYGLHPSNLDYEVGIGQAPNPNYALLINRTGGATNYGLYINSRVTEMASGNAGGAIYAPMIIDAGDSLYLHQARGIFIDTSLLSGNVSTVFNFRSQISSDSTATGNITTAYLYQGSYTGEKNESIKVKWGTFIDQEQKNYFSNLVGIGTQSPRYLLDVNGNASINNTFYVTSDGRVAIGAPNPISKLSVVGNMSVNQTLFVAENGRVGIGISTPTQKLEVAGNVNISGSYNNLTMGRGRIWWDEANGRMVIQVS